ncbi:MAG: PAS domain S-box protein [Rhodospirillaceae bacterium]|nr:PAS domain S-box protein [Rhodospirillaceae bacterium]
MSSGPVEITAGFRLGIRGRIALWFILGASAMLAIGGYIVYTTGISTIQGTLGQTYCQIAGRVSDQVQARLFKNYNMVRGIATDVLTAAVAVEASDLYGARDAVWADVRLARLEREWQGGTISQRASSLHPQLSQRLAVISGLEQTLPQGLNVYDVKGTLVAAMNPPQNRVISQTDTYKRFSGRQEHFSYIEFNREPDSITIILPVWSGTSIVGYVVGEFGFASLMEGIVGIEFGESGEAIVVDYAGVPLMGEPKSYLINAMKQAAERSKPDFRKMEVSDASYWVALKDLQQGGAWDRLACVAPMSETNLLRETTQLPPWSVVVSQSPGESYGQLRRSLEVLSFAGIAGVLFIGLVGGIAATRLTHPLRQLRDGVKQFAAGNRTSRIAISSSDEIGDLAQEFNWMADRVVISENELSAFAQAVEGATDAIILTDRDSIIYYVNPAFEIITGYSFNEAEGNTPSILRAPTAKRGMHTKMWEKVSNGEPWRGEIMNQRKNGEIYPVDLTISPIFDEDGNVISLLGVHRDITMAHEYQHRLEAEVDARTREIASTQGLAAMGRMASMVAHDLRNALSTIKMNLQILSRQQNKNQTDKADEEHFQIALGQVRYMEEFLADMLIYARPESLRIQPCDIVEIVSDVVAAEQALAKGRGIELVAIHNDAIPMVKGDLLKLNSVMHNLIENAVHAMADGGNITITISEQVVPSPSGAGDAVFACIDVADTGPGIPQHLLGEITEPFFTTRAKGTGLGLAIAKRIIEQHGGMLSFETSEGQGTTVSFTLPAETHIPMAER